MCAKPVYRGLTAVAMMINLVQRVQEITYTPQCTRSRLKKAVLIAPYVPTTSSILRLVWAHRPLIASSARPTVGRGNLQLLRTQI